MLFKLESKFSLRNLFICLFFPQEFLRKEFSEENILFWQACEYFNHVPAHDKKEVSQCCISIPGVTSSKIITPLRLLT